MVFSYNWLQSFFQKKLPKPEKLAEILTRHFAEVEEVKRRGKDSVLNIDVRPNRAGDCFSHLGIAREIAAILGLKYSEPPDAFKEVKNLKAKDDFVSVEVRHLRACPRYTAKVITDVKVDPSPNWLKDRLKVCGLRPINNIVDIANYVMLETGQPLHVFDFDKLEGEKSKLQIPNSRKKIIIRFAKPGERIVTLDEQKFDLDSDILVIADEKKSIAIAGIKGGKLPEIDKKTKTVVLESANFNPQIIRKGSKKLGLKTDASLRFEHGIDSNLTALAINRATYLIQKITKGKASPGLVDVYPKKILPKIIRLNLGYVESLLGVKIPEKEIRNILKRLGFKIMGFVNPLIVEVPTQRLDMSIPEDLIEEIGRIYGYDKIPSILPISSLILPQKNLNIFWEDFAKNILKEAGFSEIYNYSFFGEKEAKLFEYSETELIEVENPLSQEYKYLRVSLIPNLLKNIAKNQKSFKEIRIFELGKTFAKKGGARAKSKIIEKRMLTAVMTGDSFYQVKGVIDLLLNKLGISNVWYDSYWPLPEESKLSIWRPKICAEIKIENEEIGFLGEISPKILSSLDIKERVVLFVLNFERLSQLVSEEHEYRPISKFPSAVKDVAVLVPKNVKVAQVLNKIYDSGGKLIRDVDLFDIYEGDEISEGKKNLAFHIIYQAEDRTLTGNEIDELQSKIIRNLEKEPEWQVRK